MYCMPIVPLYHVIPAFGALWSTHVTSRGIVMTGIPSSDDQSNLAPMEPFARPRSHMVELALLGPPEARIDSNLLTFRTKKALALLIYLAVSGGAQPREQLATLLWPDSDEGAA